MRVHTIITIVALLSTVDSTLHGFMNYFQMGTVDPTTAKVTPYGQHYSQYNQGVTEAALDVKNSIFYVVTANQYEKGHFDYYLLGLDLSTGATVTSNDLNSIDNSTFIGGYPIEIDINGDVLFLSKEEIYRIQPSTGNVQLALSYPVMNTCLGLILGYDPMNDISIVQLRSDIVMMTYGYQMKNGQLLWNNTQSEYENLLYSMYWDPVTELLYGISNGNNFVSVNSLTGAYKIIGNLPYLYPYNYQMALDWEARIFYLYNVNITTYDHQLLGFKMDTLELVYSPPSFMILDWLVFVKDD